MKTFEEIDDHDLLTKVFAIPQAFGGREHPAIDGYRGDFYWHINDVRTTYWCAAYYFEYGEMESDTGGMCKIHISPNLKLASKGQFPIGAQFAIREASRIVALGVIVECRVQP